MSTPPTPPSRPRGPKAQRLGADQILDAAERVFAAEGFKGASLRAIGAEAGCDPALIYYHFESKEALLLALLDRTLPPLHRELCALAEARTLPVVERLWEVLRLYHRRMGHHVGLRAVIRGELIRGVEGIALPMKQRLIRNAEQVWAILQQGLDSGELRPDLDPRLGAFFLIKTFIETQDLIPQMALVVPEARSLSLGDAARAWFRLYWRGVAADPHQPLPDLPEL